MVNEDYSLQRRNMVRFQIRERGIKDKRVLDAMNEVPRHEFVPQEMKSEAYADYPLPIGGGQTISQPYMVALMTVCLELTGDENVLEVGTGSGYQAAILSGLARHVVTVEIREEIFHAAKKTISRLGYKNVTCVLSDGSAGYEKEAPYDRIIVTAACEDVPNELIEQLKEGGILVIPVGGMFMQTLFKIRKTRGKAIKEAITNCVFVPLASGME